MLSDAEPLPPLRSSVQPPTPATAAAATAPPAIAVRRVRIGPRRDAGLTPAMLDYLVSRGVPVVSDVVLPPEQATPTATLAAVVPPEGETDDSPTWLLLALAGAGLAALAAGVYVYRARRSGRSRHRGVHF